MQPGAAGERLLGTTELGSGARVVERAELDAQGRVVTAGVRLEQGAHAPLQVSFDRDQGSVVIDAASTHFDWRVPTDYPWAWAPLLGEPSTGKPIATPLLARVVLRAVADGSPLRVLDLRTLESPTVMPDQIVFDDEGEALAVVLDDTVQFKAGVPEHVHSSALGTSLDLVGTSCR